MMYSCSHQQPTFLLELQFVISFPINVLLLQLYCLLLNQLMLQCYKTSISGLKKLSNYILDSSTDWLYLNFPGRRDGGHTPNPPPSASMPALFVCLHSKPLTFTTYMIFQIYQSLGEINSYFLAMGVISMLSLCYEINYLFCATFSYLVVLSLTNT